MSNAVNICMPRSARLSLGPLIGVLLSAAAAGADDALVLEATRVDGTSAVGKLVQLTPEVVLRDNDGPVAIGWPDLLSLRPLRDEDGARDVAETGAALRFTLADGSAICGDVVANSDGGCVIQFRGRRLGPLALSAFRGVEVLAVSPAGRREWLQQCKSFDEGRTAGQAQALRDVAVVARDERIAAISGRVLSLRPDGARFEWNGRELSLRWDRIVGLLFAEPTAVDAPCTVHLGADEVLAGRVTGGGPENVDLRSAAIGDVSIRWKDINRIDCRSERLVFLSDLAPASYTFEPFFQKEWEYATDATLSGRPISIGGRRFARGISMHSKAALTYRLAGRFTRFAAFAGIVDEVGARGCVTMRVLGDQRVLWEASEVRGGRPSRAVSVDVTGVQELTLIVDYDQELDIGDHAAWGLARLIE